MNLIQTIKSTLDRSLHIILDDEEIIVTRLGNYENKIWYSWVSWGPTEYSIPSYHTSLIAEDDIIKRISLLSNEEPLDEELIFAIDHFFGKIAWEKN
jgi:hypothetical protein